MSGHQISQPEPNASTGGNQISANQGGNSGGGPPPVVTPLQPVQSPAPQEPPAKTKQDRHQILTLTFEGLGLLALIVYTIFSILQWAQIRWTNRLTRESLNGNGETLQRTLNKMQAQTDAMNRLAKAAEQTNTNSIASDRPWIGGWIQVSGFSVGQSPSAICTFQNGGKRPAFIEESTCGTVMDKYDISTEKKEPLPGGHSILLPGQTTITPIHFFIGGSYPLIQNGDQIAPALLGAFDSGDVHIKVIARVRYRDVKTGEVHHTTFCQHYIPRMYGRAAGFYECSDESKID